MKLSFSNRGWDFLSWEAQVAAAADADFQGLELYDLPRHTIWLDKGGPFHTYNIAATVRQLRERQLSVICLDTAWDLAGAAESITEQIADMLSLARDLGAPYVAVKARTEDENAVRRRLEALVPKAEQAGVTILVSTTGIYADTGRLRELLDSFAADQLAALWDIHHPFRDRGETPEITIRELGAYIKHVHMRDSLSDGGFALMGEGDLPVESVMEALSSVDYDGFFSLVWKPEWMEELQEEDVILPHFVSYMDRFANTRGKKKVLYYNHDGSGQFIWKKDELVGLSFGQVLDRLVEEFPDQYAFRYTTLDYTRTYEEFRDEVDRLARGLMSLGVRAGSKVAVWATNVPAWYLTFWAATKIGAVLVSVNTAYKIHELEYLLRQSDTHTLVMIDSCLDANYRQIITELCPEMAQTRAGKPLHCKRLPFLRNVVTVGFQMPGCLTFDQVLDRADMTPQRQLEQLAARVNPDDVCNMQYTSGTTGFPKGVMLTHYNVVNDGKCIGDRMDLSTADRMMIQVPMFHCFGMVLAMTAAMTHGATLCPLPYFSAKAALACIQQERITCFHGVPTMFIAMFNHEDYRRTDFSHMRTGIMAGAGCPPELMKRAAQPDEMNMRGIVSVYGQTESAPGSTMSAWDDPLDLRCETVGYAFPHIQCKIIDPETGEELGEGVNGEFCSRGYNTMKGYYKMPQATHDTVDAEGWLHSGDLACRDKNGCYRITGRLKDMIIRGGENIYPKEIEEFLYTHPAVKDVQVIGVPDERYGEEIWAAVIPKEPGGVTEQELRDFTKARLARHKVPRYFDIVDAFPMNAAGKVLKYKMREAAVETLKNL